MIDWLWLSFIVEDLVNCQWIFAVNFLRNQSIFLSRRSSIQMVANLAIVYMSEPVNNGYTWVLTNRPLGMPISVPYIKPCWSAFYTLSLLLLIKATSSGKYLKSVMR
jgi:hypothetical protein